MPKYLAPGVVVEEVSFRNKTIEGVSTSTTGFVGPTRFGPTKGEPPLLTSFAEFERIYGGMEPLEFEERGSPMTNYMAHAVQAYFDEGGRRLYVSRTYAPPDEGEAYAQAHISDDPSGPAIELKARHPGKHGKRAVRFIFQLGDNVFDKETEKLRGVGRHEVVWVSTKQDHDASTPAAGALRWIDETPTGVVLRDGEADDPGISGPVKLDQVVEARPLTVSVRLEPRGRFELPQEWLDLTFHPGDLGPGARTSLVKAFPREPKTRHTELQVPMVFETSLKNGVEVADALIAKAEKASFPQAFLSTLLDDLATEEDRSIVVELSGGSDGKRPKARCYRGEELPSGRKNGLVAFEDIEDISIVAAPGSTFEAQDRYSTDANSITRSLISHCEHMRYRVAILDSPNKATKGDVQAIKATIDSTHAAYYYPWIRVYDPQSQGEIIVPPSGSMAGVYARNDNVHGVHKAPANEVVRQALGLELPINKRQQEVLNPKGINCLRSFEGRGFRVWGARTTSSDPEWKYLNLRRYFAFLERSIERGTQWAVFENNGPLLWDNVRSTVEDFLFNEWKSNHLLGTTPQRAFFVRCDRTTMTQNDLDNGRLVCLVGVAPLRPAEFVVFRIGQMTADN